MDVIISIDYINMRSAHRLLKHSWLIPFKAKAWLDLNARCQRREHVDSRDLKKRRNDIIRTAAELVLERSELPGEVRDDMADFIGVMNVSDQKIKNKKTLWSPSRGYPATIG